MFTKYVTQNSLKVVSCHVSLDCLDFPSETDRVVG